MHSTFPPLNAKVSQNARGPGPIADLGIIKKFKACYPMVLSVDSQELFHGARILQKELKDMGIQTLNNPKCQG